MGSKEKAQKSKYSLIQDNLVKKNKQFFTSKEAKEIFDAISKGDNYYLRINRVESSVFDNEWIDRIEDCIPELESIIKNPRQNMISTANLVPVELARKTNAESVTHLASHTQFVKEIKENGDVIPSKILSIGSDDYLQTYENRFIATLIRRLVLFIEKRYEFIIEHALLKNVEELKVKSKSVIDGSEVEMETKIKIVKPADYDGVQEKNSFVQRVIEARNHLRYCYVSDFMKKLKTEKDVRNPIVMTNIIRKNPTYHKCYVLWKYIENYTSAGMTYSVNDTFMNFDKEALDEANMMLASQFLSVRSGNPSLYATSKLKEYKPKILRSIDDEEFEYGPYLNGPIEFVRIDEAYRKATEAPLLFYREEDSYGKPHNYVPRVEKIVGFLKKEEEEYIAEERLTNKSIHLLEQAKSQLLTRKRREALAFDRKAIQLMKNREKEKEAMRIKEAEEKRLNELMIAEEARQRLINSALLFDRSYKIREFEDPDIPEVEEQRVVEKPIDEFKSDELISEIKEIKLTEEVAIEPIKESKELEPAQPVVKENEFFETKVEEKQTETKVEEKIEEKPKPIKKRRRKKKRKAIKKKVPVETPIKEEPVEPVVEEIKEEVPAVEINPVEETPEPLKEEIKPKVAKKRKRRKKKPATKKPTVKKKKAEPKLDIVEETPAIKKPKKKKSKYKWHK